MTLIPYKSYVMLPHMYVSLDVLLGINFYWSIRA